MTPQRIIVVSVQPDHWEAWFVEYDRVRFVGDSAESAARHLLEGFPERVPGNVQLVERPDSRSAERVEFDIAPPAAP
jgi:hypothetical protein